MLPRTFFCGGFGLRKKAKVQEGEWKERERKKEGDKINIYYC